MGDPAVEPMRCVGGVALMLPVGNAANAAAVLALTMGKRQPHLAGDALVDASGDAHPGLIPIGTPRVREAVRLPVQAQQTTDYAEFRRLLSETNPEAIRYLGVMIYGPKKKVS